MARNGTPSELPVLLLYNLDPSWETPARDETLQETERLGDAMRDLGHPVTSVPLTDQNLEKALTDFDPDNFVVFNWCEELPGVPNSEVTVVNTLESLNFTYTGATPDVLALCQDKQRVKDLLQTVNVPVPTGLLVRSPAEVAGWTHFPAIVKAAHEHCSLGLTPESIVSTPEELAARVAWVIEHFHQPAMVEDFIDGREFHVALVGNTRITMLPPAEMDFGEFKDFHDRLCTYDAKFLPDSKHYMKIRTLLPAPLTEAEMTVLETVTKTAYRAVGCRDYARIDLRLRDGIFYVLDVNANADISADASIACAAEQKGWSYGQMGNRLVRLAARRHAILAGAA
jgi:D-alanine-D-alanine ligase